MPKLVVLRGPSGSGKSSVATQLKQQATGKVALVEQDYFRRTVLGEREVGNVDNIDLINQTVLFALERNYDVILEGIFYSHRYSDMLEQLAKHSSQKHFYYFDIPFEETLIRHATKPNTHLFGEMEMRGWYNDKDYLKFASETTIPQESTLQQTIELILDQTKL